MQFSPPPDHVVAESEKGLRLNFRNAPLEMVLNYLSDAAGFVIVPEVDVRGKVDVWSNQPLTKDEAVDVLNSVLSKNKFAAIRNGRMLYIIDKESAKTRDIPVKAGSDPALIPKSEEIVTQIIPIRYINASQLTRDLQPLLPMSATMTANEAGNSLVITDTQINIRRMAEIVKALDTALSSISSVRVFPLKFADA
jgi:general secretion pathway protein D